MKSIDQFVADSRRAQGLPARVEDPETIARVVTLLRPRKGDEQGDDSLAGDGEALAERASSA